MSLRKVGRKEGREKKGREKGERGEKGGGEGGSEGEREGKGRSTVEEGRENRESIIVTFSQRVHKTISVYLIVQVSLQVSTMS